MGSLIPLFLTIAVTLISVRVLENTAGKNTES